MNRDELVQMRNMAVLEVANALGVGYTFGQILEALRDGNEKQRKYADFIEHEIMVSGGSVGCKN